MDTTAHQAATHSPSHREDGVSEGARRYVRPGHQTTLKFNAAHSDVRGQTTSIESASEKTGPSSDRTRTRKSVQTSSDPARATIYNYLCLTCIPFLLLNPS